MPTQTQTHAHTDTSARKHNSRFGRGWIKRSNVLASKDWFENFQNVLYTAPCSYIWHFHLSSFTLVDVCEVTQCLCVALRILYCCIKRSFLSKFKLYVHIHCIVFGGIFVCITLQFRSVQICHLGGNSNQPSFGPNLNEFVRRFDASTTNGQGIMQCVYT